MQVTDIGLRNILEMILRAQGDTRYLEALEARPTALHGVSNDHSPAREPGIHSGDRALANDYTPEMENLPLLSPGVAAATYRAEFASNAAFWNRDDTS